ncbi:MAG: glutamate mutase L [Chloroflexota bacterium]|jgi:hypothetical protein
MTRLDVDAIGEPEREQTVLSGRSYLVVDYGQSACMATLYDLVEGRYRMVGRGEGLNTAGGPWFDLTHGLQQAIGQIADATGRKLLTFQGQLIRPMRGDGSGVDYFGATVSLGEPLKVLVAGLSESASIASARKALQSVYAREVGCLSLEDGRRRPGQIETILAQQPDVIFFVGGTDGGADKQMRELLGAISLALELQAELARPIVIYGGNAALRSVVVQALEELTELHLVGNVRPAFEMERLDHAIAMLAQVYCTLKVEGMGSSGVLADWSNSAPMLSAHAFGGIAEYLAAAGKGRVLGVDVGSGQVTLVSANEGVVDLRIQTDKGLGRPLRNQLTASSDRDLNGATGANGYEGPLADYILDKSAHPGLIPQTSRAAKFELALASRLIRQALARATGDQAWPADGFAPPCHTLLVRGRVFTNAANKEQALQALLDGLRPRGVYRIVADGYGILPAMGLLAAEDPDMVVQVLTGYDLIPWAWGVSLVGHARTGKTVINATLTPASGEAVEVEVVAGGLEILPLGRGQRYRLELKPAVGIDVGAGPGQERQLAITSARIGLVIDGRNL